MNAKFFDMKKEKQDATINASLKVFAENGYKKASTDFKRTAVPLFYQ